MKVWNEIRIPSHIDSREIDKKKLLDRLMSRGNDEVECAVFDSAIIRGVYYAAIIESQRETGEEIGVRGVVCLYKVCEHRGMEWFNYLVIGEEDAPRYFDCPRRILNVLTPTKNLNAQEWRTKCRDVFKDRKEHSTIDSMRVGSKIAINHKGNRLLLTKIYGDVFTRKNEATGKREIVKIETLWIDEMRNRISLNALRKYQPDIVHLATAAEQQEQWNDHLRYLLNK